MRLQSLRPNDENTGITNFYQIGRETLKINVLSSILCSFLDGKAFEFLRTKNQLGYSVSLYSTSGAEKIYGIYLVVASQEKKFKFTEVYEKMNEFIDESARTAVNEITDEEMEKLKNSLIKKLVAPDLMLLIEFLRNLEEITMMTYDFDKNRKLVEVAENLTKADLKEFFSSIFDKEEMKKISVQIIGSVDDNESDAKSKEILADYKIFIEKLSIDENLIEEPNEFRDNLFLYEPVLKYEKA